MSDAVRSLSMETARRLAVLCQHLGGGGSKPGNRDDLLSVVRDLGYVQIDPLAVLAPTQVLTLWNRVDGFSASSLDRRLWTERKLLELNVPPASIVLAEDYPLHYTLMRRYPETHKGSWGSQRGRAQQWLATHEELGDSIVRQLEGTELTVNQFEGHLRTRRRKDGWTSGSDVAVTLGYLEMQGRVMTVRHEGHQRVWGLPEDFLPPSVERKELPLAEAERAFAERAIRAMGTASRPEINYYFPRGRYVDLRGVLRTLEADGTIHRVVVEGFSSREARYLHSGRAPLLDAIEAGEWTPRLALLAPFDNLIPSRQRTNRLFGFDYTHGNYLRPQDRKYGLNPLPILDGDRIIGRVDARMDREHGTLSVPGVYAEPRAPNGTEVGRRVAKEVARLGRFLGANEVVYGTKLPAGWRSGFR
jgi:uncharacterized protein